MAKNQSTYTLKIDAELGNLQKTLHEAKNSLSSFMASGNAPKGLEKAFEKISNLLGQITDKAGKPLDLKGLNAAGKDLDSVQESFRAIIRLLGEFDDLSDDIKLSFLSPDEQKKIQDATKALQTYGKAMEEVAKKQKSLESMQKTEQKNQVALDKAKKKVSGLSDERTLTQAKLTGAQGKLEATKGLENANPKDVAKYEAEVAKLKAELEILDKNLGEANKELNTAQIAYNGSAEAVKKMEAEIKRASGASLKQLKEEATALGISLEGLNGHNAAKQVEILTNRLEEFKKEAIKGARPAFEAIKRGCEGAEKAADGLQDELKEAVEATKAMDEAAAQRGAFENKIKSFLGLSGAAQVMRAALRDAISTITELDAVMGQMAVVTDLTVGDYWDQLPEYSERASKLGVSITSAYEAATLYYQQGLKANEVTALSEQTLKMAAIAGLDAADATDRMTAALRGFNMELNEANAQNIADVYSELAAITAADVDEISTAMTKTASIASSAGMEFETTAAFLSQIIETTRESAETAGTAMKTVIARFQELKKDPSEIGEIDGEIVDANAIETALRSVGVSLRDSAGQFRELDDVFLELSSKWDSLDKNTQRYIATIAAGSRQQSRFIAMMSDYKRTVELVDAANTSAGASQKQFEKTTETLQFKVNQLKNAWHEFTMGIMNSDLVKTGVDILTKFLNIVNKATSGLDGIGGSLTKIIGIVAIFNIGKALYEKISGPISGLFLNEIPKIAREGGFMAGIAWKQGVQAAMEDKTIAKETPQEQKKGLLDKTKKFTGWENFAEAHKAREDGKLARQQMANNEWATTEAYQKHKSDLQILISDGNLDDWQAEEFQKEIDEIIKAEEEFQLGQIKLEKSSQKVWSNIAAGVGQAGQAISAVGLGMSALGGILSSLGLEEFGEGIVKAGNYVTIFGSILMTLPAIFSLISTVATAAGITISAALWIVTLIVAAVAIIAGTIAAIVATVQKNSPEGKLKAAKQAADEAAESADKAKEAYNDLASSFDKLSDKYKALEELTKGTKEWNKAVLELNAAVMDLISQYPELSKFVKNTDGVLKIDFANPGVQNVLQDSYEATIGTSNVALAADVQVSKDQRNVDYDKLSKDLKVGYLDDFEQSIYGTTAGMGYGAGIGGLAGLFIGGPVGAAVGAAIGSAVGGLTVGSIAQATAKSTHKEARKDTDILAKAVYQGAHLDKNSDAYRKLQQDLDLTDEAMEELMQTVKNNEAAYRKYGEDLYNREQQEVAAYDAMASSVLSLVDTMGMSEERIKQMYNIVDGETYQKAYEEMAAKLTDGIIDDDSADGQGKLLETTGFTEEQMREAFSQAGYKDGVFNVDSHKVKYIGEDGTTTYKKLEIDEVRRILSTYYASNIEKNQAENMDEYISGVTTELAKTEDANTVVAFEKALMNKEGDELTLEDYTALKNLTNEDIINAFNALDDDLKEIYGSADKLIEKRDSAVTGASFLEKTRFKGVNAGAARGLEKVAGELTGGYKGKFEDSFNDIIAQLPEQKRSEFAALVAGMSKDPTNRGGWDQIETFLEGQNITTDFADYFANILKSRYSIGDLTSMGVSKELVSQYEATTDQSTLDKFHATFKKWKQDYDTVNSEAAKAEHELIAQIIDTIIDNREKQIDAYEEAVNAEAEANSNLISKISDNVARLRELREKEETEKAISENLSKQAYLGMDTSGGNALELLQLQEENKQMTQDYEDTLIDQAIAKLEEDNDKALEQREKQIELMREQLEIYKNSDQILADAKTLIEEAKNALINGADVESTALGDLLKPEQFTSAFEQSEFWNGIREGLAKLIPENTSLSQEEDPSTEEIDTTTTTETIITPPGRNSGSDRTFTAVQLEATTHTMHTRYKTGGLASFTGPAWLDGTPSKPEYVLNAEQTERFFSLIDVLEGIDTKEAGTKSSGDNYFDINIQVDKLEDDYSVEQMANKIRRMIYEDATYRNVNVINHIR